MANHIKQIKLPSASGSDIVYDIINPYQLTVGQKTYDGSAPIVITPEDLGLSSAMLFLGTTITNLVDGSTTNPVTINSKSVTVTNGNVVIYGNKEFVWTGSLWEELGNEGNYKVKQTAVPSPIASGSATAFIDTISQNADGVITVTKKNIPNATSSSDGLMSAADKAKLNGIQGTFGRDEYGIYIEF